MQTKTDLKVGSIVRTTQEIRIPEGTELNVKNVLPNGLIEVSWKGHSYFLSERDGNFEAV